MSQELTLDALEKDLCIMQEFLDKTDETLDEYVMFVVGPIGVAYMIPDLTFQTTGLGVTLESCAIVSYANVLRRQATLEVPGLKLNFVSRRNAVRQLIDDTIFAYDVLLVEWINTPTE